MGTITPGGADVYSYDEDNMVIDPKLAEHLAHFGINMMIMNKVNEPHPLKYNYNTRLWLQCMFWRGKYGHMYVAYAV